MPIVVNSNPTATTASMNLSRANDSLRKSLARLSSGKGSSHLLMMLVVLRLGTRLARDSVESKQ